MVSHYLSLWCHIIYPCVTLYILMVSHYLSLWCHIIYPCGVTSILVVSHYLFLCHIIYPCVTLSLWCHIIYSCGVTLSILVVSTSLSLWCHNGCDIFMVSHIRLVWVNYNDILNAFIIIISFIRTCIKIHTFQLVKKGENPCF